MHQIPEDHTGPGLVDIQVNGYAGLDFNGDPDRWTAEAWRDAAERMRNRGVVTALPTLVTDDPDRMVDRARRYAELVEEDGRLGEHYPRLHVEGPFVSPEDGPRGAHPREHCTTPTEYPELLEDLHRVSGKRLALFTLAPELDGAMEVIERCAELRICPAIGHTGAARETLERAVRTGARLSSHLGNGSHQKLPRLDNYVQTQLADDRLMASFIGDGHHMPFSTLQNFLRAKTPARSILITDAIPAAELGAGRYRFGGQQVEVNEQGRAAPPGAPHLAGSTLTMDRAVLNVARHCHIPWQEAWAMASTHPADLLELSPPEEVTVRVKEDRFELLHA